MLGILRKDAGWFALFAVPIMGMLCAYDLFRGIPRDLSDVFLTGFYVILIAWGGMANSETFEAYGFLKALPLTDREVVAAKFLLVAVTVAASVTALVGVVLVSELDRANVPLAVLYLVCAAVAGLLIAGLAYSASYAWGFARVRVVAWVAFPLLFGAAILFIELVLQKGRLDLRGLMSLGPWPVYGLCVGVAIAGLAGYRALMDLAIRTKQRREV